ncbi:MAG TPA: hypothetical protein VML75_13730 [Kofleriaceae bacterium]|nr:hypothetical protein [Kofleriaceae bacterium]
MNCPRCGAPTIHVPQYQNWYCQPCQAYVPVVKAKGVNLWLAIGLPLALVAVAVGIVVYLTTRSFEQYVNKSKTSEVRLHLLQIQRGARMYFEDQGQLPGSAALTPASPCCTQSGKCQPDQTAWDSDPSWRALEFAVYSPHYYQYEYELDADGQGFTARAHGDLDCDGSMSTFEVFGRIEAGVLRIDGSVSEQNPTE